MNTFDVEFKNYQNSRLSFWDSLVSSRPKSTLGSYYHQYLFSTYAQLVPPNSNVMELGCGYGNLLRSLNPDIGVGIDFSSAVIDVAKSRHPKIEFFVGDVHNFDISSKTFDYIIISELINDLWDVQLFLEHIQKFCNSNTRIIFNFYSHLWNIPLNLARHLKLADPVLTQNWLTKSDMQNLLEISGYQELRGWRECILPIYIPGISDWVNRYLAKIWPFSHLSITNLMVARSLRTAHEDDPSVSVIIAARNESGNIQELIERIPRMGSHTEIIFVEGGSTDDTQDAIKRGIKQFPDKNIKIFSQTGVGKGDAVRLGFEKATCDILMILDADITVPPEDLPRFYGLMKSGSAEFVNGVRLVYPMQEKAMRFFNLIGNKFFSAAFSWLLGQPIRDTLCGTKVLWKTDYERIAKGRSYFGDFDPFGDFDLLFGAARLNLKILEVPIRYRARQYGETNISRWRHGWLLLRMVVFAARRIKFAQ
jgi:SAM-dependent methyltransferase